MGWDASNIWIKHLSESKTWRAEIEENQTEILCCAAKCTISPLQLPYWIRPLLPRASSTTPGASWVPFKASTLNCGARGTTVAPSDCRAWLGWRGSVCCSHGGRFNSRLLPVCLFLVSVYLRLTPCLHVTHWHLPPAHIAEQASFLAGAAKKEKRIFSQRFKRRYVFRIPSAEEL